MASSGVAFFGKPSFCLPTINNTGVCSKDSGFKIILENLRFLRLCLHYIQWIAFRVATTSYPIGESLLTSLFSFFLVSIRLNP